MASERGDKALDAITNDWGVLSFLSESAQEALKIIRQAAEKASSDSKTRAVLPDVPVGSDSTENAGKSAPDNAKKTLVPDFVTKLLTRKETPPISAEGCKERPGECIKQADNSIAHFDRAADGKVRPRKITFSNGSTCTYDYDKDGHLIAVSAKDKEGKKDLYKIEMAADGSEKFTLIINGETSDGIGELSVRSDGTWKLVDVSKQRECQPCFDGSLALIYRDEGETRMSIFRPDGVVRLRFEAEQCVWFNAEFRNGTTLDFIKNGEEVSLIVRDAGVDPVMSDNMNVRLASPCCTTPKISSAGF